MTLIYKDTVFSVPLTML